jgi:mannan endo-1,4-beta-mannosidase
MDRKFVVGAVIALGVVALFLVLGLVIFTPPPARQVPLVSTTLIPTLTSVPPTETPIRSMPAFTPVSREGLPAADAYVTVRGGEFMLGGRPYYFVGTNFWQGVNLGVNGSSGDRARLVEELDHLRRVGVTNLRVMASSEGPDTEPYRMAPALMIAPGEYNESVFDGMDFFLAEMGERDMKAVMVLNNYWHWSGGMAQYVSWHEGTSIPYPGDWGAFMVYSAKFYGCAECQAWYRDHIATVIDRENPYTGLKYRDDPTIFAWELANEPRRYPDAWIDETAAYIKSLDPNHMVTTGSEGTPPGERQDFVDTHDGPGIDYVTIHIWPQNWGWYNPQNPASYTRAEENARDYFQDHVAGAATLGKPLVLEEFGLARDWEPLNDIYDPDSPTTYRDLFYAAMFGEVYASMSTGGPAAGDNFWAWGGQTRPGDDWIGDPPHEIPGWYSVYDTDESTLAIISAHAEEMASGRE